MKIQWITKQFELLVLEFHKVRALLGDKDAALRLFKENRGNHFQLHQPCFKMLQGENRGNPRNGVPESVSIPDVRFEGPREPDFELMAILNMWDDTDGLGPFCEIQEAEMDGHGPGKGDGLVRTPAKLKT